MPIWPAIRLGLLLRSSGQAFPPSQRTLNIPERRYSACLAPNGVRKCVCVWGPQPFTSTQKKQTSTDNSLNTHTRWETHTSADATGHERGTGPLSYTSPHTRTHAHRGGSVGWSLGICRIWPGWSLLKSPGELSTPNPIIYHQNIHTRWVRRKTNRFVVNK